MNTREIRKEAGALLQQAEAALTDGDLEKVEAISSDAQAKMAEADRIDKAASDIKKLQGEFQQPTNTVPVASKDVAAYDADDNTAKTKGSYRPSSWVKSLPAMAQPLWVQEQMGDTEKEHAKFQTDTFTKWLRSPSDNVFWKTATPDEVKAMQEDTDTEGGFWKVPLTSVTV